MAKNEGALLVLTQKVPQDTLNDQSKGPDGIGNSVYVQVCLFCIKVSGRIYKKLPIVVIF